MMQDFIGGNDVLIAEQGSSFFGAYSLALPKTCHLSVNLYGVQLVTHYYIRFPIS